MGKTALIAVIAGLATAGLATADEATVRDVTLKAEVSQTRNIVRLDVTADALLNRLLVRFPASAKVRVGAFRTCNLAVLQAKGPRHCPRRSRVGTGTAAGPRTTGGDVSGRVWAFNGELLGRRTGLFLYWRPAGAPSLVMVGRWETVRGRTSLDIQIPPIRVPEVPAADVRSLSVRLGATDRARPFLTVPCPANWWARGYFPTGDVVAVSDRSRCRHTGSAGTGPRAAHPIAPPLELEQLPPGPLPGIQVRGRFRVPGVGKVRFARRLAATGSGARRTALLIARGGRRELCLTAVVGRVRRAGFRCQQRWDRPPLLLRVGVGGRSRKAAHWMALVGLVRQEVGKVGVDFQQGAIPIWHPRLRSWPGFPWKAFAVPPAIWHRFPSTVWAEDVARGAIQDIDLGWAYGAACGEQRAPPCTRRRLQAGAWASVRDPLTRPQSRFITRVGAVRAKRLAFDHPVVRQLVAGQPFSLRAVSEWSSCNRRRLGAVMSIRLASPITFEGDVPVMGSDDTDRAAYLEGVARIRVENAVTFDVYVDLNRSKVVGISPGIRPLDITGREPPASKLTEFTPLGELRPAGGPDSGDCGKYKD